MDKITYDTHEIDFDHLPAKSQAALVARGVTHFLGNEQASKVSAWVKAQAEEGVEVGDDEKAAKKAEYVAAAIKALTEGTVGSRSVGPRATPFESALRAIAKEEVSAKLKAAKIKVPKGKETITYRGNELTLDDLIDRHIEREGERLVKDANARVRESEKRVKASVAAAEAGLEL